MSLIMKHKEEFDDYVIDSHLMELSNTSIGLLPVFPFINPIRDVVLGLAHAFRKANSNDKIYLKFAIEEINKIHICGILTSRDILEILNYLVLREVINFTPFAVDSELETIPAFSIGNHCILPLVIKKMAPENHPSTI